MRSLQDCLKFVGAIPVQPMPRQAQLTEVQREFDKIRYRIGAIAYKPGQEYLLEPVQWNVLLVGAYDKIKDLYR